MTKYRLLKDLPVGQAGNVVFKHDDTICFKEGGVICSTGLSADMLCENSWFEEIKGPADSIHWKPEPGDTYWFVDYWGVVNDTRWDNTIADDYNFNSGNVYHTEEECRKARNRRLAEIRLRRTSTFKPDFENDNGGWVLYYNPQEERLEVQEVYRFDYGEIVRYETKKDALKSIKENREDWLIYFGIEEG